MDLSKLFADKRLQKKPRTHIVMKSVGLQQAGSFRGWIHPPKFDKDGNPAHEIYAIKNKKAMEEQGWVEVPQVAEPKAAATPKTKKTTDDVE